MDIVDKLLIYYTSGDINGLITEENVMKNYELRVVVIEILAWLKLEHKRSMWIAEGKHTCLKPMKVDIQYPWCAYLYRLVENEKSFHNWFSIQDGKFDFSDQISEQDRSAAREKAYQNYNPPRSVHVRKTSRTGQTATSSSFPEQPK